MSMIGKHLDSNDSSRINNQGLSENGVRCASELIFSKSPLTPKLERRSAFDKKMTKQAAQAESLLLYHQLEVNGDNERSCGKKKSYDKGVPDTKFPFSFASDLQSTPNNTGLISDNVLLNFGSIRCKSKKKAKDLSKSLSLRKYFTQTPHTPISRRSTSPSPTASAPSPSLHRIVPSSPFLPLQRSLSVNSSIKFSRRRKLSLFGHRSCDSPMSSTATSIHGTPAPSGDVKVPSPARFTAMYHAVRKAISEHISVNMAELNVLEMRQNEPTNLNALVKYLERVIKKLQYQQTQLDEIHEAYILQQRYREGAFKLKSALHSSRVSSRSSKNELKADLNRSTETLCTLEQDLVGLLGRFHFDMKGLLGFAKLRSGDQYEIVLRLGSQKWRMRGSIKAFNDQVWDNNTATMQPLLSDIINVKVMEIKLLGKHSTVGNVVCETKDLFKVEPQDLTIELNDTATLKLNLKVRWIPFEGYETPQRTQHAASSWTSDFTRSRAKSVAERPMSSYISPRTRLASGLSRPISAMYAVQPNANNSNNNSVLNQLISHRMLPETKQDLKNETRKNCHRKGVLSEEDAFNEAISSNSKLAAALKDSQSSLNTTPTDCSRNSESDILLSRKLLAAVTQANLDLDDYRGRYEELCNLEDVVLRLLDKLKMQRCSLILTDGFSVVSPDVNKKNDVLTSEILETHRIGSLPTTGLKTCDEAVIAHLNMVQNLLKDVGAFGPLKVREVLALHKLQKQARILNRLLRIALSEKEIVLDDMEEFETRRTLLEMWRSCCDGSASLCISAKTLRLELTSEFGSSLRTKHPDVCDQVFPELIRRILERDDVADDETVTLFHVSAYVDHASDGVNEGFEKLVEKLAYELFITSTLSSGDLQVVLLAIKRVSSLLALRTSNLRALSHLLLNSDHQIRTASAAHIRHISAEPLLRNKALLSFSELLESHVSRDRQCACIAIGFLCARECIPQLAYLYQSDAEFDVRDAASNVLLSMGDEGSNARDDLSSTLLVQTITQKVAPRTTRHLGTAL